ncbi:hypothetical protein WJX74_004425 [Apatococcus lobatus]|uniref:Uncharacterized protein n=1 Tax=Apatococcus lobatus TaxID=904363 RepID=A0AAW1QC36_9CHLO
MTVGVAAVSAVILAVQALPVLVMPHNAKERQNQHAKKDSTLAQVDNPSWHEELTDEIAADDAMQQQSNRRALNSSGCHFETAHTLYIYGSLM